MAELRKIEIPEVLKQMPMIMEAYDITDKYMLEYAENVEDVHDDIFIFTSTEYGIARREKILGIVPSASDDLEERRLRVLIEWTAPLINQPLTFNWIKSKIASFFDEEKVSVLMDYGTSGIEISIHDENIKKAQMLCDFMDKYLPVGLWYRVDDSVWLVKNYSIKRCGVDPIKAEKGSIADDDIDVGRQISDVAYEINDDAVMCGKDANTVAYERKSIGIAENLNNRSYVIEENELCGADAVKVDRQITDISTYASVNAWRVSMNECGNEAVVAVAEAKNTDVTASLNVTGINIRECGIYRCVAS